MMLLAISMPALAQTASYEHPTGLRYIGTINNPRLTPACSYLSKNPINNGAFLWAPAGSKVMYTDTSTGAPTAWNWACDGGTVENTTAQDAIVTYSTPGTYNFPVETVTYGNTQQTVAPEWKLKVGGVAEICLADTRTWIDTYALGINYYDNTGGTTLGQLGGANALGIEGVGNLYMMPGNELFLDGVNVYLNKKPQKWPEGRKITVTVYMSNIGQSEITLTDPMLTLESGIVGLADIKTAEDGAWVLVKDGAVMQIRFVNPVDLYGKPFIFISVSGWGDKPAEEDFAILSDVMPNRTMSPEDAQNLLAHNSFARIKGETDYLRPISYYGGNYGSFMICPLLRGYETPFSGIGNITTTESSPASCSISAGNATITGADGTFAVYNIGGAAMHSGSIIGGSAEFNVAGWAPGIYVMRDSAGQTAKFVVR